MLPEEVARVKRYMSDTIPALYNRGTITNNQLGVLLETAEKQLWPGKVAYRVLVCGSRMWGQDRAEFIRRSLSWLPHWTLVAHGACRGVDLLAAANVPEGVQTKPYPAPWDNWRELGLPSRNAAGPYRNREMYLDFLPDLVIAFHDSIKGSGTANMVDIAVSRRCETWLINPDSYPIREILCKGRQ